MQHHLFFSLIEREGPYNVQKKAVHVGAYASKAEAMTRFEGMLKKFPATWEPSIIPASLNPIDTFLQNQKTISFTGSTDPELREKYPKIDWAFDHPEGKTIDFAQWQKEFLEAWKSTMKATPTDAAEADLPKANLAVLQPSFG